MTITQQHGHFMIYGYKQLKKADDWRDIVGPDKWRPTRSAYELAHHWHGAHRSARMPLRVKEAFRRSEIPLLQSLRVVHLYVEHPTFLDTDKAPSYTDIMVLCRAPKEQTVIIGVEGKSTERFAGPIIDWIKAGTQNPTPSRLRRLQFLIKMLGVDDVPHNSLLRYQLVHRTASVVTEAALRGAGAAVVLVHSFAEETATNWIDFQAFLKHIGLALPSKDSLCGPIKLGPQHDVPTYFGWVSDKPVEVKAKS